MQPGEFIDKWREGAPAHGLGERAGAQAHFIDLCRLLDAIVKTTRIFEAWSDES